MSDGSLKELRDIPVKLEKIDSYTFQLTKEDGTLVKFRMHNAIPSSISQSYAPFGYMKEIVRPDGFTIKIHKKSHSLSSPINSVTSNNGLQLKYIYDVHSRPLAPSKQNATNNPQVLADSLNWSYRHPIKVIALNNAIEVCPLLTDTCNTINSWPTAHYSWPDGMPRAFYIGNSVFSVEDSSGRITSFHHKALSRGYRYGDSGAEIFPGLRNEYFPRIVKISKPNGSTLKYRYVNNASVNSAHPPFTWLEELDHGILYQATLKNKVTTYTFGSSRPVYGYPQSGMYKSFATGDTYHGVTSVVSGFKTHSNTAKISTKPIIVESWDKKVILSNDLNNHVEQIENKLNNVITSYEYDNKSRLIRIIRDGIVDISYPSSYCSPKNCNQPLSISSNYNGFQGIFPEYTYTRYQYASGLPQTTTYPANKHNKVKKVQYSSQNYTARYKNSSGNVVSSPSSISLISSEYFCRNSNMSGATCAAGDKITTTYHYGSGTQSNNLFLIGETISAQDDSEVYTTCYKYDKYGNRIGVSLPESGITDCNAGREF